MNMSHNPTFLKSILLALATILLLTPSYSQTFNKSYGVNSDLGYKSYSRGSVVTENGIYIGFIQHNDTTWDSYVGKVSIEGELQNMWNYGYPNGGVRQSWCDYVHVHHEDELIISNSLYFISDSLYYGLVTSLDFEGNILWQKMYGDSIQSHRINHVKSTSDGGLIAVGEAERSTYTNEIYVVKTDSVGNEEWHAYLGDLGNNSHYYHYGFWIDELEDSTGFVLSGYEDIYQDFTQHSVIYVLDTLGEVTDFKSFPNWSLTTSWGASMDYQSGSGIISCSTGGFAFTTKQNVAQTGDQQHIGKPQLVRLDSYLDTLWTCFLDSIPFEQPISPIHTILETPQGDFVTVGSKVTTTGFPSLSTGRIHKVTADGELLWRRSYNHMEFGHDQLFDIDLMPNGGYLCTGWTVGHPELGDSISEHNVWLLAVDSMGCLVPGCDTMSISVSELNPIVFTVYPNPADQFINVAFSKHDGVSEVVMKLFDIKGRLVKQAAVSHNNSTYIFDSTSLVNGTYILSIGNDEFITTEKILISH